MAAAEAPMKAAEAVRPDIVMHEVMRGETLTSVCAMYNADMEVVRRANGIPSTSDYLGGTGRVIRVPDGCRTVLPPVQSEEERRAELLYRFALNHGLSPQDAGVYLRLAEWDEAEAETELRELAEHEDGADPPTSKCLPVGSAPGPGIASKVQVAPVPAARAPRPDKVTDGSALRKRLATQPRFGVGV